eukprot:SAG31_NODE_30679_length_377_cov_1.273381_1_plen_47_part_10
MTPFLWACEHGQTKCVEVLLEAGCNFGAKDILHPCLILRVVSLSSCH